MFFVYLVPRGRPVRHGAWVTMVGVVLVALATCTLLPASRAAPPSRQQGQVEDGRHGRYQGDRP